MDFSVFAVLHALLCARHPSVGSSTRDVLPALWHCVAHSALTRAARFLSFGLGLARCFLFSCLYHFLPGSRFRVAILRACLSFRCFISVFAFGCAHLCVSAFGFMPYHIPLYLFPARAFTRCRIMYAYITLNTRFRAYIPNCYGTCFALAAARHRLICYNITRARLLLAPRAWRV